MTRAFEDAVSTFALIVCVGAALIAAWSAMRTRQTTRADIAELYEWAGEMQAWAEDTDQLLHPDDVVPEQPDDFENTVISHPADSFARRQFLLQRRRYHGAHRAADGGVPATTWTTSEDPTPMTHAQPDLEDRSQA